VKFAQKPQMLPGTRSDLGNPHTHTHFDKGRKHSESKESREAKERKSIPGSKGKVKVAHQSDFVLPTWEGNLHPQSL